VIVSAVQQCPIIVVSLKDSLERRKAISNKLNSLELSFQFYNAVDAREAIPTKYEKIIDRALTLQCYGAPMNGAEYGCALSHYCVYEYIVSNGFDGAIVLEDDAIIDVNFKQFVLDGHHRKFDMLFLAHGDSFVYKYSRQRLFRNFSAYKAAINPSSTTAYFISVNVAHNLLNTMIPIRRPADNWPFDLTKINTAVTDPSIIRFDKELPSEIGERHRPELKLKTWDRYCTTEYYKNKFEKIFLWKKISSSNLPLE